jgi:hypothetical protein
MEVALDIREKMGKEGSGARHRRAQKKAKAWYGTAWYKRRGTRGVVQEAW